ncbi:MAG: hypothetical protein HZB92_07890 [Euryarchaeota archaeon]|nr:hypothetical protein [Euryarchaeota archaeon]
MAEGMMVRPCPICEAVLWFQDKVCPSCGTVLRRFGLGGASHEVI